MVPLLPAPPAPGDQAEVVAWVADQLGDLTLEGPGGVAAGAFTGGQAAADAALAGLDVTGYAGRRSQVLPVSARGASRMSPYLRHGLLTLPSVWAAVRRAPERDRSRYRDELMWAEYARHLYARVGRANGAALRREQPTAGAASWSGEPWPAAMACMAAVTDELRTDGWVVNQTRMWLASQWTVRAGANWRDGEQEMYAHLLDGSRASNRLGWQGPPARAAARPTASADGRWRSGRRRCAGVARSQPAARSSSGRRRRWGRASTGPTSDGARCRPVRRRWRGQVRLSAESLGVEDPALLADPDRPAVFVFDEPLLARLRLSGKRLVFLAETLGDLAARRPLEVRRGVVGEELAGRSLAATWTPVPGWARRAAELSPVEVHPWPWLARPRTSTLRSFSAWRREVGG